MENPPVRKTKSTNVEMDGSGLRRKQANPQPPKSTEKKVALVRHQNGRPANRRVQHVDTPPSHPVQGVQVQKGQSSEEEKGVFQKEN